MAPTAADVIAAVEEHVAELIVVFDATGTVVWVNGRLRRILGYEPVEWVGRHAADFAHPDDIALGMELLSSSRATGAGIKEPVTFRVRHSGGGWRDLECVASNVETADGLLLVATARPAEERRSSSEIMDEAAARVAAMFDDAAIGMAQVDLQGSVLRANRCLGRLVGVDSADMAGRPLGFVSAEALGDLARRVENPTGAQHVAQIGHGADDPRHVRVSASLVRSRLGAPLYYAVQVVDVTELVRAEAELAHRARHDPLTGLANRAVLDDLFDDGEGDVAVLYLDLDGFKAVNDLNGHAIGDEVLCTIADRLRLAVRGVDVVVRLGGDEFVVACDEISAFDAIDIAERLVGVCALPIAVSNGLELTVGASVGVALGGHGRLGDLLRRADRLLYEAKAGGGGRVAVETPSTSLAGA